MKRLTFIKTIDHIQLGHLYEHIYCANLSKFFRNNGLYAYIDYNIDAKTYYDGYIRLEVELYSTDAVTKKDVIQTLNIDFTQDEVIGGLLQIMAEKYADVKHFDEAYAISVLRRYHSAPWEIVDGVGIINVQIDKKSLKGLQLIDRNRRKFARLKHELTVSASYIDTDRETLLPLFVVLSRAIGNNLRDFIPNNSFCFSYEDDFIILDDIYRDINLYSIDKRQATSLTDELEESKKMLHAMIKSGFVKKLSLYLKHSSTKSMQSPDDEEISTKTGMIIGPKGWKDIGTEANILDVLRHMTLAFSLGKSEQSINLSDVF